MTPPPSETETIFGSLAGTWTISRRIESVLSDAPSGRFTGLATFTARDPTADGYVTEYIYSERGTFVIDQGGGMIETRRKYVYRLGLADGDGGGQEQKQCQSTAGSTMPGISVWFTDPAGPETDVRVDKLFHTLSFQSGDDEAGQSPRSVVATGSHLCDRDMYYAGYVFTFQSGETDEDAHVDRFRIKYDAEGPSKDYTSETWFSRAPADIQSKGVHV